MEENTQLPAEVVEEIKDKAKLSADFLSNDEHVVADHIRGYEQGWEHGATSYAPWKVKYDELCEKYKALDQSMFQLQQEQPGAVWVKASEFKYEVGMAYHAKDSKSKGAGSFDDFGNFFWGDGSFTAGENQDDLLILDESAADIQIDREWVNNALVEFALAYNRSNNKDIANDAAEYLNDKLNEAGVIYVLSEDESAAGREEDLTAEDIMFLNECNIYIVSGGLQILTENDDGGVIQRDEVGRLIEILNKCATKFKQQKEG